MSTVRKIIDVDAPAAAVWDVIRDVGAVHTRLAPGFVIDTKLEDGARVVTFANGVVARERIIAIDDELRRLAYSISSEHMEHHNASYEVIALSEKQTRVVWTTDVAPDSAAERIRLMMEQGSIVIRNALMKAG